MRLSEFHKIIVDEKSIVHFLQLHSLHSNNSDTPNSKKCDSEKKIVIRKKRLTSGEKCEYLSFRCVQKRMPSIPVFASKQ